MWYRIITRALGGEVSMKLSDDASMERIHQIEMYDMLRNCILEEAAREGIIVEETFVREDNTPKSAKNNIGALPFEQTEPVPIDDLEELIDEMKGN